MVFKYYSVYLVHFESYVVKCLSELSGNGLVDSCAVQTYFLKYIAVTDIYNGFIYVLNMLKAWTSQWKHIICHYKEVMESVSSVGL